MLYQINQNPYFGCFKIYIYIYLDIIFISCYCFRSIILFPIIVFEYYFISYHTHIMSRVQIDVLEFVLGTFITFINLSINSKLSLYFVLWIENWSLD